MDETYTIRPIGVVQKKEDKEDEAVIRVYDPYVDGLSGLSRFSHVMVLYWFSENDTPEKRATLAVHPCNNPDNPLTGVFATHSPMRPNLIALTVCRILSINGGEVHVKGLDAFDGSPVIDLKCYFPKSEDDGPVVTPDWLPHRRRENGNSDNAKEDAS